jgi:1-acyl-sn-glycerol-3-phosphate acyltransferase
VNEPVPSLVRALLRPIVAGALKVWPGMRVTGALPEPPAPLVLACNHASHVDVVYVIAAIRRPLTICGAHPRLFRTLPSRTAMRLANVMRVDGHQQFIADCASLIERGCTLLTFPEMRRNPAGMGAFETWAAEVAMGNRVALIPSYLHGTTCGDQGALHLAIGAPLDTSGTPAAVTERCRAAMIVLRDRARVARQRGLPFAS